MGEKNNQNFGWDIFKSMASPDAKNLPDESMDDQTHDKFDFNQRVRVLIDKKRRGGKAVTIIEGLSANDEDMKELSKTLKTKCGGGGAYKNGQILLQGNHREKVMAFLIEMGFKDVKKSGG